MKRDTWTPSKHQLLCSDHFTPDSLDVRWGIRYLKHTAIPTIFSLPDNQEKDPSQHKPQEIKTEDGEDIHVCAESDNVSASFEPCSPKKSVTIAERLDENTEAICLSTLSKPPQKKVPFQNTENLQASTIILSSSERHVQQTPVLMAEAVQNIEASNVPTSVENLLSCTATVLQVTDPEYLDSSLKFKNAGGPVIDHLAENPNSHIAVCSVEVQPSENAIFFSTITRTIEQFNGNNESVIAIIVPAECSKESSMGSISVDLLNRLQSALRLTPVLHRNEKIKYLRMLHVIVHMESTLGAHILQAGLPTLALHMDNSSKQKFLFYDRCIIKGKDKNMKCGGQEHPDDFPFCLLKSVEKLS
ncbi:THAP domain-containing protein 5 [Chelonia mydas]|uniref:THAP domain-containing protein 5 n=1 Tax=Chelonia mydas TaxID=8469 RepID=M7CCX5_CHEMY|nr:THAP domain-containing protein 5 [Chelonia mydas]